MTIRPRAFGRSLELIEPFLADARPANPDMCREVLRVALGRRFPTDPRKGNEYGAFFMEATIEVYTQVYAAGSGTGHTFELLERWFRWMGTKGHLGNEDVALWLFELERSRRSYGGMKARYVRLPDGEEISGREVGAALSLLRGPPGLEPFLENVPEPDRKVAQLAVKSVVVWLAEHRGAPIILDDFDPTGYLANLLEQKAKVSRSDAQLMHHVANYLEKRVADDLVARTRELALSLAFAA